MQTLSALIWLPLVTSFFVPMIASERWARILTVVMTLLLVAVAGKLFFTMGPVVLPLGDITEHAILAADVVLLLFFAYQGVVRDSKPVAFLAVLQLLLFGVAEYAAPAAGVPMVADELSKFMFLVVNGVGGVIVVYAVSYMSAETMAPARKRLFLVYLILFLAVMNALVMADSLLHFFFLFEMTTLASYLLIAFRGDETARANALRALWMNQVGGVLILLASLVAISGFGTLSIVQLLVHSGGWIPLVMALLGMAALVKGAAIPFDSWLLGAMVAPTPVSAILHSATMVKIAPFLILKLAPVIGASFLGSFIAIFGAGVFVAASYLALSRSLFKEILGYSTIALLGLMVSLAAVGTRESMELAMALILFHALSKALLFLTAGVLEKVHHVKDIEGMKGLVVRAPSSVAYVMFGFVSLTLPPFGMFLGKLFAIASVASLLQSRPLLLPVLLGIIVGSALLVLLYFKVASALLARPSDIESIPPEHLEAGYTAPLMALAAATVLAAMGFVSVYNAAMPVLFLLPLLLVALLPFLARAMCRFDRVKPYHCGEKEGFESALFYFEPSVAAKRWIYRGFGVLFVLIALVGALA